ncbi:MAG: glycerate kinase [Cyanobacteriota bacterium]|jgi:glycerate kinase
MTLLLAPDSFKGTLSAPEVCQILAQELSADFPILLHPLADGGEGTLAALALCLPAATWRSLAVQGPLSGQKVTASYLWLPEEIAMIEMAQASGLTLVPPQFRDPEQTTSYGVGQLLQRVREEGARQIYLAIGGSATQDGGVGMLQALGWRFLDAQAQDLPWGGAVLRKLARILPAPAPLPPVTLWCDVTNPLYGPEGSAFVFAPQKGADMGMVERLDQGLRHLANIVQEQLGINADFPGAGAAGGLGSAGVWGLGAQLTSGFGAVAQLTGLEKRIESCQVVITGEGRFDAQSLRGKVVSGVLNLAQKYHKPLIVIAGESQFQSYPGIAEIISLVDEGTSSAQALAEPQKCLRAKAPRLQALVARLSY